MEEKQDEMKMTTSKTRETKKKNIWSKKKTYRSDEDIGNR